MQKNVSNKLTLTIKTKEEKIEINIRIFWNAERLIYQKGLIHNKENIKDLMRNKESNKVSHFILK